MTRMAWARMALAAATCAVLAVCGPAGLNLWGTGWANVGAAVGGVAAIVAGCWPWYRWQRAEVAERTADAAWRRGMDDLAVACGFRSYDDYERVTEQRRRVLFGDIDDGPDR